MNNGMCLPSHRVDIVWRDLTVPSGEPPKRQNKAILTKSGDKIPQYCELDIDGKMEYQAELINNLNALSLHIEIKILFLEMVAEKRR